MRRSAELPPGLEGVEVPEVYTPYVTGLRADGERNWVLHLNHLAVEAMRHGDRELAERALDESILNINNVFGSTAEARRARNIFFAEDVKLFKGDPYERCMAFFYRGVLYMQRGDWGNARASFRSAVLQDAFAEEEQFRADWALLDYLIGVCELQLGRQHYADEAFARAQENRTLFQENHAAVVGGNFPSGPDPFTITAGHNVLVLVQDGQAPRKVRAGDYGQHLAVRPGATGRPTPRVQTCAVHAAPPALMDSLYYQATTRGGRPFDRVQNRKVVFKSATDTTGDVGLWLGANVLMNADGEGAAVAGLVVLTAGLVFKTLAALATPRADIRAWTNLPDSLFVYTPEGCTGEVNVTVNFSYGPPASTRLAVPESGHGLAVVLALPGNPSALLGPVYHDPLIARSLLP